MNNKSNEKIEVLKDKAEVTNLKPVVLGKERFSENWYKHTETGIKFMPPQLAKYLATTEKAMVIGDEFYFYENGVYRKKDTIKVNKAIKDHIDIDLLTTYKIIEVRKLWGIDIVQDDEEINKNDKLINFKNGLYDVTTNLLRPHTPDYLTTIQVNVNYNEKSECPEFKKWVSEMFLQEDIATIQEMIGYIMLPSIRAQKMFVIKGEANSGKSTFLNIVSALIGKKNISNIPMQNISDTFKTAQLNNRLLNVFADLPSRNIGDNTLLKALVTGDGLTVEEKHKTPFEFNNISRFLFSANKIPLNQSDDTNGFYRRLIILSMDRVITESDPNIEDRLMLELDGIAMWALQGLKRLIKNNYKFTESNGAKENLMQYKNENNSVLAFFNDTCCIKEGAKIATGDLYQKYVKYCTEMNIVECVKIVKFSAELKNITGVIIKKARINGTPLSTVFNLAYIGG